MHSPRARTGRMPGGVKPIAAALAVALMGMGGVALAAPKADPGPHEQPQGNGPAPQAQDSPPAPQAQANGPAPQAQANGPAPQAHDPAPPPQAKAKRQQGAGKPADVPPAPPPQAGAQGNPAPGESRGRGETRSSRAKSGECRSAGCRQGGPKPNAGPSGGGEQPQPAGEQPLPAGEQPGPTERDAPGGSGERPDSDHGGTAFGEHELGAPETETGSVLGANQGGGQEVEADTRSFDTALPFTGFEVVLLAGIGALLWLVGLRLRRSAA
jgi:hypothetical protein